jgi:uncharacterized protein YfaS (alpha-2-macroglobulin family)
VPVRWATVDFADEPAAAPQIGWTLQRLQRNRRLVDLGGHLAWSYEEDVTVLASGIAEIGGSDARSEGSFELPVDAPGRMRLVLRAAGGPTVAVTWYAVDGDPATFVPPLEDAEAVVLEPLVASARPGDEVEIDVRAPFDGSLLVTLEDHLLRSQQRVELVGGSARLTVQLPEDLRGGAFLSAQLTRPLERRGPWLPHRAYGYTRLRTLHTDHELTSELRAPERVRPGGHAVVEVIVPGLGERMTLEHRRPAVHLFAVDEGIRLTGGDVLPDPARHFLAPRAASVRATDAYFDLLPDRRASARRAADRRRHG